MINHVVVRILLFFGFFGGRSLVFGFVTPTMRQRKGQGFSLHRHITLPSSLIEVDAFHTKLSSSQQLYSLEGEKSASWMEREGGALWNLLISQQLKEQEDEDESLLFEYKKNNFHTQEGSIKNTWYGLGKWKDILRNKGRLPIKDDFEINKCWPSEPTFSYLIQYMTELQMAQFVQRHPEIIHSVLLTILRIQANIQKRIHNDTNEQNGQGQKEEEDEEELDADILKLKKELQQQQYPWLMEDADTLNDKDEIDEEAIIEEEVVSLLVEEFGSVVNGMRTLDFLFPSSSTTSEEVLNSYGSQDGIWKHVGWKPLKDLLEQVSDITELQSLLRSLGKRPTSSGTNQYYKFNPYIDNKDGAPSATINEFDRTFLNGISYSNKISEMLPSEAALLVAKTNKNNTDTVRQNVTKQLFYSKLIESKLMSYKTLGWEDIPAVPKVDKNVVKKRLPSAPGGPIIICLDTSWSMVGGMRESLSKAVVIACITAAHKQNRDCYIVAFSSANNVMAIDQLSGVDNLDKILEFCSNSFVGGGTDVTGALKHAMKILHPTMNLDHDDDVNTDQDDHQILSSRLASADILMITDGEIPNPPVSDEIMRDLTKLQQKTGMQIHGLLIGNKDVSREPLESLCTVPPHDFLLTYDQNQYFSHRGDRLSYTSPSTLQLHRIIPPCIGSTKRSPLIPFWKQTGFSNLYSRQTRKTICRTHLGCLHAKKRNKNYDEFDEYNYFDGIDGDNAQVYSKKMRKKQKRTDSAIGDSSSEFDEDDNSSLDQYSNRVENAYNLVIGKVQEQIDANEKESTAPDSYEHDISSYRDQLDKAIKIVGENLIEREEDSRLVVLGLISGEHVLLLGPPGTGKSALGRRLSQLCGQQFFQRLLTRFTTPEEIFGPLSLKALENDEYKRCTDGFLPTASVAFLDEIFKANSAILNTLLTILNERQFDNGAGSREYCPIRCVVGASNELPDSEELDAIYDRFLLRKEVQPVSDEGLMRLLSMQTPGDSSCNNVDGNLLTENPCDVVFTDGLDNLIEDLSKAVNENVVLDLDACFLLRDLRKFMKEELDVNVSDRRLVKATRLLKLSAASHGRSQVDMIDCLLLQHIAWRLPEQRIIIKEWLWNHMTPGIEDDSSPRAATSQFRFVLNGLRQEAMDALKKTSGDLIGRSGARPSDVVIFQGIALEAENLLSVLKSRSETLKYHIDSLSRAKDHLWLSSDEGLAAQQILTPKAEMFLQEINRTYADTLALKVILSPASDFVDDDLRHSVLEKLWDEKINDGIMAFTDEELNMDMRDAKASFDVQTFQKWKRTRKALNK